MKKRIIKALKVVLDCIHLNQGNRIKILGQNMPELDKI